MGLVGVLLLILGCFAAGAQSLEKTCEKPMLQHGRVPFWYWSDRPINTAITYHCYIDYIPVNKVQDSGYGTATCTENGWDPEPKCLKPCHVSNKVMEENSIRLVFTFVWWFTSTIKHGDSISFTCLQGYGISNSSLLDVKCNDGFFHYPKCTKLVGCGPPPEVPHGEIEQDHKSYEHNSAVTYKCHQNYTLVGEKQISCRNGQWEEPPVCKGPCTLSEEVMEANGIRLDKPLWWRCSPIKHGCIVSFSCAQAYEISNSSLLRAKCNDGVISYPTCLKQQSCGPPPVVPHAKTVQGQIESYEHGSVVTYLCAKYYKLEGKHVTCRNGTWDDPPTCREPCVINGKDLDENNINQIWPLPYKRYVEHGEFIVFYCLEGYDISNKDLLLVWCEQATVEYPKCTETEEGTTQMPFNWRMFDDQLQQRMKTQK
ncbi:coagulation factor XIII B chain isoform X1 [Xenopus laevis]|uniref:Sushi domain-containing protein n=3 Tax=Xenopus laevis TaxID=8355 RepID=A0A974CA49_XENLA|nr:coagulation factor XIII B chain isoform X1 [Xenopus laevis]OCT69308.1 hypothetical protein XELAEV_18040623mg [Xenopus laevis]